MYSCHQRHQVIVDHTSEPLSGHESVTQSFCQLCSSLGKMLSGMNEGVHSESNAAKGATISAGVSSANDLGWGEQSFFFKCPDSRSASIEMPPGFEPAEVNRGRSVCQAYSGKCSGHGKPCGCHAYAASGSPCSRGLQEIVHRGNPFRPKSGSRGHHFRKE